MKGELDNIKFTLTEEMVIELLKYNKLKKQYISLMESGNNKELKKIKKELTDSRKKFVSLFQSNNETSVREYLEYIGKDEI